jgi:hypothetical protein
MPLGVQTDILSEVAVMNNQDVGLGPWKFFLDIICSGPWIRKENGKGDIHGTLQIPSPQNIAISETISTIDQPKKNFLLTAKYPSLKYSKEFLPLLRDDTSTPVIELSPCSPLDIIREIVSAEYAVGKTKGISISYSTKFPFPRMIQTDSRWLRRTVGHGLTTLLEASGAGEILVKLSFRPKKGQLCVTLHTTHCEASEKTWRSLLQSASSTDLLSDENDQLAACKAGLTLCLRAMRELKGELELKKSKGKGASIQFSLSARALDDTLLVASNQSDRASPTV